MGCLFRRFWLLFPLDPTLVPGLYARGTSPARIFNAAQVRPNGPLAGRFGILAAPAVFSWTWCTFFSSRGRPDRPLGGGGMKPKDPDPTLVSATLKLFCNYKMPPLYLMKGEF